MREIKKTGVVWCPSIPTTWHIDRVKNYFIISKDISTLENPTVLKLARSGIYVKDVTTNEGQMAESYDNYNKVKIGDLLLNPMDLYSGANCNVSEVEGVISPAYTNLRAKRKLNPKFFDYYFKVQYWAMAMFAHGKGVSFDNRWTINAEGVKNYEIPIPSFEEQNCIVEAINRDCAKVDALIANQEAQIEKLKQYKQSLITEVVTKGLDLDAPMKDSGVEWIGNIPAHWAIKKIKYVSTIVRGGSPRPIDEYISNDENGYNWIKIGDTVKGSKFITGTKTKIIEAGLGKTRLVHKGDLILTNSMSFGEPYILDVDGCIHDGWLAFTDFREIDKEYLYYCLISTLCHTQFIESVEGGIVQNLNINKVKNSTIFLPPIDEQIAIISYLDKLMKRFEYLTAIKEKKIEKLTQYKKSLIYEYVTGKKEVI